MSFKIRILATFADFYFSLSISVEVIISDILAEMNLHYSASFPLFAITNCLISLRQRTSCLLVTSMSPPLQTTGDATGLIHEIGYMTKMQLILIFSLLTLEQ